MENFKHIFGSKSTVPDPGYAVGDSKYSKAIDLSLTIFADGRFDILSEVLSLNLVLYFPVGLDENRKNIKGLDNFIKYWQEYRLNKAIDLFQITEINCVPIQVIKTPKYVSLIGNWVFSWFNVIITTGGQNIGSRVNATFHFNNNDQVDYIFMYYNSATFTP